MSLDEGATALARTRLSVPVPIVPLVTRPRVLDLLDEAIAHPVTLVTGGAGAGKSMAVADWTRRRPTPGPVVWASLTDTDADERRLRATVAEAASAVLGPGLTERLAAHEGDDAERVGFFLALLGEQRVVLVLDDVHEIERGSAIGLLEAVTRHPPPGLHLVLVSRHDPPLSLHRLRISGRLGDVRAADLAFTADEARLMFDDRLDLPEPALAHLVATTEGWAAGLRLAHMALTAADDPAEAAFAFDGRDSRVAAYLMDEMRTLDDGRQQLLLTACVTDEICAPLAIALSGNPAAGSMLEALAADDLFMVRRGAGWYRLHQLVLQSLRARLHATQPDLENELHRRAAAWFEEQDEWLTALRHAVRSRDWSFAGRLAVRSAVITLYSPDRDRLLAELDRIPGSAAFGQAELEVALAYAEYCRGDLVAVAHYLDRAEANLTKLPEPRCAVTTIAARMLRASVGNRLGDAGMLLASAREADRLIQTLTVDDAPGWLGNRGLTAGLWAVGELWNGRPERAIELLERSVVGEPAKVAGFSAVHWYGLLALADAGLGRANAAIEKAEQALSVGARDWTSPHDWGTVWLALATAATWQGDLDRAHDALERGEAANGGVNRFVSFGLRLVAARRRLRLGELMAARQLLGELDATLAGLPPACFLAACRAATLIDIELASGAPERAASVLTEMDADCAATADDPGFDRGPIEELLAVRRGRILLATGREHAVRAAVGPLLTASTGLAAHAWLLVCLAEDAQRHDSLASDALARSLNAAAPEGLMSLYAHPGPRLVAMLRRHLDVAGSWRAFVEEALASSGAAPAAEPSLGDYEALTERELSVLAYLPTLRSNSEIADGLGISVNTVKQHLKSIHRKLGVGTRRDAVRVAHRLGLLNRAPGASWE